MNILKKLVAATAERVARQKNETQPFPFEAALKREGISFICEVKKASPSRGLIAPDFPYLDIARQYEAAGADAISVLTEPDYFLGSDDYLREIRCAVNTPLLRKDFIIDPWQIEQSRRLGADAILLIAAILTPALLGEYIRLADSLGLSCLVEAHDENELKTAVESGARVIGVNNRDLRDFSIDLNNSIKLRELAPKNICFVAESGIQSHDDIAVLEAHRIDAVLVGEALMQTADKRGMLARLRGDI